MSGRMRIVGALTCALALAAGGAGAAPVSADVVDDNLAAVVNNGGEVELFARGRDGEIYTRMADGGNWTSLGGKLTSGPAAMARADGAIDVFARGTNDEMYQKTRRGSTWSKWTSLGGILTSAPAATERRGTGIIELFHRGTDNGLWLQTFRPGQGWSGHVSFGGSLASAPAVVSRIDGWADLFVRWSDNTIRQRYHDGNNNTWSGWFETPRQWLTLSAPSATVPSDGRLEVFHRGLDRKLWQRSYDGSSFGEGDYQIDEREMENAPTAIADRAGGLRLYTRFGDNVHVKKLKAGGGFTAWSNMGPVEPAPPQPAPAPAPEPAAPRRLARPDRPHPPRRPVRPVRRVRPPPRRRGG